MRSILKTALFSNRIFLAASGALLLGGATLGVVLAQQTPTPTTGQGQARPGIQAFWDGVAKHLGITTDRLQEAMTDARKDLGLPDRSAGRPGGMSRPESRPGGSRPEAHGMPGMALALSAAAQALGITPEQLRQELPGKSLADVARAHGKSPADVAAALKSAANQRIDQAVAAGRFDPAKAKAMIDQKIDQALDRVIPQGRTGARPGQERGQPGQPGGQRVPGSDANPRSS
ncbi:MAG: hypothetical protein EXR58_08065 [Chloroflexi bacterium]|nr:hypothetical protein [Chloroflexota bacterium]